MLVGGEGRAWKPHLELRVGGEAGEAGGVGRVQLDLVTAAMSPPAPKRVRHN